MDRREAIQKYLESTHSSSWGEHVDISRPKGMERAVDEIERLFQEVELIESIARGVEQAENGQMITQDDPAFPDLGEAIEATPAKA